MEKGQETQSFGRDEWEKGLEVARMSEEEAYLPSGKTLGVGGMAKETRGFGGKLCPQGKATVEQRGKEDVFRKSTAPDSQVFRVLLIHY